MKKIAYLQNVYSDFFPISSNFSVVSLLNAGALMYRPQGSHSCQAKTKIMLQFEIILTHPKGFVITYTHNKNL